MKLSAFLSTTRPVEELLESARSLDEQGWHGVWLPDHYMPDDPRGEPHGGPMHEVWGVLPAIAATTSRVRLGTLVTPTTMHHPAALAKRAVTLDHVSRGRFVLGLGAGWQVNEHRAYGYDLLEPKARVDRFQEALEVLRLLLDGERATYRGRYFVLDDAPLSPLPVQPRLPLLVGSSGRRMLNLAARHADEWNTWGTPETLAPILRRVDDACQEERRQRAPLVRTCQVLVYPCRSAAEAESVGSTVRTERSIVGSLDHIAERLLSYRALGIDEVIVPDFNLGAALEDRLALLRGLGERVLPSLDE